MQLPSVGGFFLYDKYNNNQLREQNSQTLQKINKQMYRYCHDMRHINTFLYLYFSKLMRNKIIKAICSCLTRTTINLKPHTHWAIHNHADRILDRSPIGVMFNMNRRYNRPIVAPIVVPIQMKHVHSCESYQQATHPKYDLRGRESPSGYRGCLIHYSSIL